MAKRKKAKKESAKEQLKWETAREMGLDDDLAAGDGGLTVREAGKIGGNMVRKLVEKGEEALAESETETETETENGSGDEDNS
ncbi:MAG: small, acid-soluble spore protein, alpha/beta type [Bacillota bacterium]